VARAPVGRGVVSDGPLVYVHAYAPPTPGGTPVILRRLLLGLAPREIITVTDVIWRRAARAGGATIPGRYHWFLKLPPYGARWRAGRIAGMAINRVLATVAGVQAGLIARRNRACAVLSVADNGFSVIAGDIAARVAGVPHAIWVFDLWEENAYSDVDRWVASRLEGPIWRRAAAVISHTPVMSEYYERKHGVSCVVLPTPVDPGPEPPERRPAASGTPREVLFAGALYWAQVDALARLARACAALDGVRLTAIGDPDAVRAAGIEVDTIEGRVAPEDFQQRVREADVAFLGLSFHSPHPEVIATATPARLPEYLASGTPMLVHAPAGSHAAEYARREDFAEIVDVADEAALAAGIRRVVDDEATASMRAARGRRLAVERHETEHVRALLRDLIAALGRS
jgi:glycosyltransferase involved in cell wall biosynthesis